MTEDTTKIRIQGGINAANGINAVFMVESVMAVSRPSKITRDRRNESNAGNRGRKENGLFAEILNAATDDVKEAPAQFQTVVYGRNMQLTSTRYQTREYHY